MTCIAGIAQKGSVWIGGDSAGVAGHFLTVRDDSKVFTMEGFVFGFTTSFRMGQLLKHSFKPPKRGSSSLEAYMVTTFIDAVRSCLKEGGYAAKENEVERGGSFLVGHKGRLFHVGEDYQVGIPRARFDAVGCGADLALGSLHTTRKEKNPKSRIRKALKAAEAFSAGVRGPFRIEGVP